MELDHIRQEEENLGFKVCRNIRNALVNIVKYRGDIQNYEATTSYSPDHRLASMHCYVMLYLEMRKKVSRV